MQRVRRAQLGWIGATLGMATACMVAGEPVPPLAATPVAWSAVLRCSGTEPYRVPAPGSTGIPPRLAVCTSGPIRVSEPGVVVDGWNVHGGIDIEAPDVLVRRSRVTGDGRVPFGIRVAPGASVRIEDTTFNGAFVTAAIGGDRWTGERVDVSAVATDGAHLGAGARLRNSTVQVDHDADGIVVRGPDALAEDNTIEAALGSGSAVRVTLAQGRPELDVYPGRDVPDPAAATDPDGAPQLRGPQGEPARSGTVLIRRNQLSGGRYTLHENVAAAGLIEVLISNNRFARDAGEGPMRVSSRAVIVDNTFADGAPLPPQ